MRFDFDDLHRSSGHLPLWAGCLLFLLLTGQGLFLFLDSRKQGRNPWFWGLLGLIQAPWPTVFYLLLVRKVHHRWRKNKAN